MNKLKSSYGLHIIEFGFFRTINLTSCLVTNSYNKTHMSNYSFMLSFDFFTSVNGTKNVPKSSVRSVSHLITIGGKIMIRELGCLNKSHINQDDLANKP